jgi:hypothetical protein
MEIQTERPIAVFDLDGCLISNPSEAMGSTAIGSRDFWANHWNNPDGAEVQQEVVDMLLSLAATNWQIIILTARPDSFREQTVRLLRGLGIFVPTNESPILFKDWRCPVLVMYPDKGYIPSTSGGGWKQGVIREWLDQGANIKFMVEDYPPNAEAIRAVVPVLLYERKKPSRKLVEACQDCGGVNACWCSRY